MVQVGCCETSPNQQLLAWTEDTVGGEKYTLRVKVRKVICDKAYQQAWISAPCVAGMPCSADR
jgi:protease II